MTTTDIGILLVVLCIVLWAIMAALHRHTVQLEALKAQMAKLLAAQQRAAPDPAERVPAVEPDDDGDRLSAVEPGKTPPPHKQRTFQDP